MSHNVFSKHSTDRAHLKTRTEPALRPSPYWSRQRKNRRSMIQCSKVGGHCTWGGAPLLWAVTDSKNLALVRFEIFWGSFRLQRNVEMRRKWPGVYCSWWVSRLGSLYSAIRKVLAVTRGTPNKFASSREACRWSISRPRRNFMC